MITYLALGIFAGFLTGMLGIGGGVLIVPSLVFLFHHEPLSSSYIIQTAAGTSLAIVAFNSLTSVAAYQKNQCVDWLIVKRLLPSLLIGALLGTTTASLIKSQFLAYILGVFLVLLAIEMQLRQKHTSTEPISPPSAILNTMGIFSGMMAGLVGIGGGVIIIPFLTHYQFSVQRAAGTTIACALFVATISTINLMLLPYFLQHPEISYIFWPAVFSIIPTSMIFAWVGAHVANKLPVDTMRRIFALFLGLVGIYIMLYRA